MIDDTQPAGDCAPNLSVSKVSVDAEGSVRVMPDRATLTIRVWARERDRRRTVDSAVQLLQTVEAELDRFEVPRDRRRTDSVTVTSFIDPKTRKRSHFEAWAFLYARFDQFERLGEIHEAISKYANVDVSGPAWEVSESHSAHTDACRKAAATARSRASAFAEGAGMELGRALELKETAFKGAVANPMTAPPMANPAGAMQPEREGLVLSPGTTRLSATVRAVFELVDGGS